MKRESGTASRAGSTGDRGRRNRFPTRIHTKKGRSALILRTFCPEKREWTFDSPYVTSSLSPFLIASENLLGSVLGKMKSEKTFLCETQEGSL